MKLLSRIHVTIQRRERIKLSLLRQPASLLPPSLVCLSLSPTIFAHPSPCSLELVPLLGVLFRPPNFPHGLLRGTFQSLG